MLTPPPFSPNQLIERALLRKVERNPAYSLRALARDLGVSHTYLSLVLRGKKKLSLRRAFQVIELGGKDPQETHALMQAATLMAMGPRSRKQAWAPSYALELERFKAISEWHVLALLELSLTESFRSDPAWVSKRLGIPKSKVLEAVRRLERLGLLRVRQGHWKKMHGLVVVPTRSSQQAVRKFHTQMIRKALTSMSNPAGYGERDITGITFPVDISKLPAAREKISRFRKRLMSFLADGKLTELYQLNVQLFPLSRPVAAEGRK